MPAGADPISAACQGSFCPVPDRVSHSAWMSHIPFAFWLIEILRPRIFVELGAYTGASFCAFCQQIDLLNLPCEAYAIDAWQGDANMGYYGDEIYNDLSDYIAAHYAGFAQLVRSDFNAALNQFQDKSIDLLHIDGFHSAEAMLGDFEAWLPKVSDRGVILMHDINARLPGYGGPEAWAKISARFPAFAFRHGYGLGMVIAGKNAPPELGSLATLDQAQADKFANIFQRQAKIYEKLFWLEEQRKKESRESAGKLDKLASENETLRQLLEKERLERLQERQDLRDQALAASLKADAFANSLSWKLTAPLRKAANLFRS